MNVDALVPNDPRVEHKFLPVGDYTYHYLKATPDTKPKATVVLAHGWPDIGMGWRYQVPYLLSLGVEVLVLDMLGYGQTSSPDSVSEYTLKSMTSHVAAVIKANTDQSVILGGHDWGSVFVWRMAMYYPELTRAVFGFCVPYFQASPDTDTLEKVVQLLPNFQYQLSNRAGAVEAAVGDSPANLAAFMNGMFGGTTPEGEPVFDPEHGIHADRLARIGASPLLSQEMLDFYVVEYSRHGLRGPCNWYRMWELNSEDELAFARDHVDFKFKVPAMIVMAQKDPYLPPHLADGMEKYFSAGLQKEVLDSSHWTLLEKPEECNKYIGDFITGILAEGPKL